MHPRALILFTSAAALAVAAATGACSRKPNAPELQTTTGQLPRSDAVTVSGCLRAGLGGENTFVLMTVEPEPARTATYQLTAPGLNLGEYAGQRVNVSGTVRAEEDFSSIGSTATDKAVGTGGTPTVKSKTELDVKLMTVTSINRTAEQCAPPLPSAAQDSPRK